jgi:ribonuclease HI
LANGKAGASAGVGVFFGRGDPRYANISLFYTSLFPNYKAKFWAKGTKRNISERLAGEPQTNQRAELTAILKALQVAPVYQAAQILTDSQYSINCVTKWYQSWEKKNWLTAQGEVVKNQDLVKAIRERLVEREKVGTSTTFQWVKGHASDPGNTAADQLAVQGARLRR